MPGKKKKKSVGGKKKKKLPTSKDDSALDATAQEPQSMMGGENGATTPTTKKKSGKKKKGSKKVKLSLAEKVLIKLEKGVELLKANKLKYDHFVQLADTWLLQNGRKLRELMMRVDMAQDEVVSYDEIKSACYDMNCPLNMVESHLLCKLLDFENSGDIEYMELNQGLRHYMKKTALAGGVDGGDDYDDSSGDEEDEENLDFSLVRGQSAKDIKKCPCCLVGLWTPQDTDIRYIDLSLMLITFADTLRKHPCHFAKVVHTHLTIYGLIQLIKSEVGIQSTTISVFRDKSRSPEAQLDPSLTLEDCGYDGRSEWYNPQEHVLYYDYTSEFNECPILMCDHYFTDLLKLS